MKKAFLSLLALSVLAGCMSYTPLYKPGLTSREEARIRGACEQEALGRFPVWIVRDRWPVYGAAAPGQPAPILFWEYEVYDQNEGPRRSYVNACLGEAGFQRVDIPWCEDSQIAGRSFARLERTPQLTPSICALRTSGGNVTLIDLSKPLN